MGLPQPIKRYTPQEYYRLERDAPYKSDYYKDEIFAMAGGTIRHSTICINIGGELRQRLKGKPCAAYESNLRLKVQRTGLRCYPDNSVFCDPFEYDEEDLNRETVTNPTVLFEVLSPSTELYDRGLKAENYRQIESLKAYVFISQSAPHVEIYSRQSDGTWVYREARGMEDILPMSSIGINLPLSEIYDRVDFTTDPSDAQVDQPKPPRP